MKRPFAHHRSGPEAPRSGHRPFARFRFSRETGGSAKHSGGAMLRSLLRRLSLASFVGAAISQATANIRSEVAVAKAELLAKIRALIIGAVLILLATGVALFAIGLFSYAATHALAEVWPMWLSAISVGGVLLVIGLILLGIGLRRIRKNADLRPERLMNAYRRFNVDDH